MASGLTGNLDESSEFGITILDWFREYFYRKELASAPTLAENGEVFGEWFGVSFGS
jgi:hypothetical protein